MELIIREGKKGQVGIFELLTSVSMGFNSLMNVHNLGFYASYISVFTKIIVWSFELFVKF